jgi:hypothetical protein
LSKGFGKVGLLAPKLSGLFSLPQKRGIMPRTPARHCGNYTPGHSPHHIQARKAIEGEWLNATVLYQGSDLFQLKLGDSRILVLRNHEPGRLNSYLEDYSGNTFRYSTRYKLLGIPTDARATAVFSMSDVALDPCN